MAYVWVGPVRRFLLLGAVLFLATATAGCGRDASGEGKTVPVAGKVLVGDKPLTSGTVIFHPDGARGNASKHEPRGDVDGQGNYRLKTTAEREGVSPGWYKVAVVAAVKTNPQDPYSPERPLVNPKYFAVLTSGLEVEVVETPAPGAYDLKLTK